MAPDPLGEFGPRHCAGSDAEDGLLLFVDVSGNLLSVEQQEDFHRGVANALVSVDEGMPLDECEAQRSGLLRHGGVELGAIECGSRLGESGLDTSQIAEARCTTRYGDEVIVETEDLRKGEVSHFASLR